MRKFKKNTQAFWNATVKDGPELIGFGRSVLLENESGQIVDQMAVVGFIRADRFVKALQLVNLSQMKIVNRDGEILLPTKGQIDSPLFDLAVQGKTKTSVVNLEHNGEKILGAFSKAFQNQIYVLAEASEDKAFFRGFTADSKIFDLFLDHYDGGVLSRDLALKITDSSIESTGRSNEPSC